MKRSCSIIMDNVINYTKKNKVSIDGIIIAIVLMLEVCNSKFLVAAIPILAIRCLLKYKNKDIAFSIDRTTIWLVILFSLTLINGLRLDDNADQFSVIYNMVTFLNIILIQFLIKKDDYSTLSNTIVNYWLYNFRNLYTY